MTIEQHTQSTLTANAALVALVPASRIKVPGEWQNLDAPYVIHFPVSIEPTRTHEGLEPMRFWDYYQVSVFAPTYSAGRAVCDAVIAALDGWHGGVHYASRSGTFWAGRDPDVELEHFVLNFRVAEALNLSPA